MKNESLFVIFILFCISCANYRTVRFPVGDSKYALSVDIPKGYKFQGLVSEHGDEDRYWYPDSVVIYITTFPNTLNYKEIQKQSAYSKLFLAEQHLDSLSLSGKDASGLLWKDRVSILSLKDEKVRYVIIGYSNASLYYQVEFEKALTTLRQTKRNGKFSILPTTARH